MCYLDDILDSGKSEANYLKHLEVLCRLQEKGACLNRDKCRFLQSSVEYLDHFIDMKGIRTFAQKMEAINQACAPHNMNELQSFIGLVN